MLRKSLILRDLILVLLMAAFPLAMFGKSPGGVTGTPMKVSVYDTATDEQNTTAFYNNGTAFCSSPVFPAASWTGDSGVSAEVAPSPIYSFSGWTPVPDTGAQYVDSTDCGPNQCLHALLDAATKILSLDTRGTLDLASTGTVPREFTLDFTTPCFTCSGPAGSPTVFGTGKLTTPALVNLSLTSPYTSMAVCSSTTCPEAQPGFAKIWFADPVDPSVEWRIDYAFIRVLRMSGIPGTATGTWYVIADGCDGTQIAGLSKLIGNRTRPKVVFNGWYLIPFLATATPK